MRQARGILLSVLVNVQRNDKSGCKKAIMKGLKQCSTLDCTTLEHVPRGIYNKTDKNQRWMPLIHGQSNWSSNFITTNQQDIEMMKGRVRVVIDLLQKFYTASEKTAIGELCAKLLKGASAN